MLIIVKRCRRARWGARNPIGVRADSHPSDGPIGVTSAVQCRSGGGAVRPSVRPIAAQRRPLLPCPRTRRRRETRFPAAAAAAAAPTPIWFSAASVIRNPVPRCHVRQTFLRAPFLAARQSYISRPRALRPFRCFSLVAFRCAFNVFVPRTRCAVRSVYAYVWCVLSAVRV